MYYVIGSWLFIASLVANPVSASEPSVKNPPAVFDRFHYFGELVKDATGKTYVVEHKSQTHSKENFIWVRVKNIKKGKSRDTGRIRVAVWNKKDTYAKEGVNPYRGVSFSTKNIMGDEMLFKIGGFSKGEKLSFFAHFDEENAGKVAKFLGIPTEQFIFSNSHNQGKGPGLTREGLSAPTFEKTLVTYTGPGQEVVLTF